jgi:hypothetical protein
MQVTRNTLRKYGAKLAAVPALALVAAGNAMAAVPESVSTETASLKTDGLAIIGMIMGALIAVWGLKKLASKFGWV